MYFLQVTILLPFEICERNTLLWQVLILHRKLLFRNTLSIKSRVLEQLRRLIVLWIILNVKRWKAIPLVRPDVVKKILIIEYDRPTVSVWWPILLVILLIHLVVVEVIVDLDIVRRKHFYSILKL